MLQGCFKGHSRILEKYFMDVSRGIHRHFKHASMVIAESFKGWSKDEFRMLQLSLKDAALIH